MSGSYHLTSQAGWNSTVTLSIYVSSLSLHVRMKLFAVVMVIYDVVAIDLYYPTT